MSNKRVSELNELAAADLKANDLFLVVDTNPVTLESKKIKASSVRSYVLDNGVLTGSITNAIYSDTASYLLYTGVPNGTSSNSITASYVKSSSWSDRGQWARYSDTASYIDAADVYGTVPSSSTSLTASYLLYQGFPNGTASYAITSSYVENAQTSSNIFYVWGQPNGTASYAMSCSNVPTFDGTASYLLYQGFPNGTASAALTLLTDEITSSYLVLKAGRVNGTASYAISSSYASGSNFSSQSYFLWYTGKYNGTASHALTTDYCDFADVANIALYCSGTASYSLTSSVSTTSSYNTGTSSYAITSSHTQGTSSFAVVSDSINDPDMYRIYGPYNSNDTGGTTTTTEATIQNFIIKPPGLTSTTIMLQALLDIKTPITQTEPTMTIDLYLDYTEPSNTWSYGPVDTSRPANYISLAMTGAFSLSGYSKQSVTLGSDWYPVSGSWYRLKVSTTGGALIDTTRGVTFFVYTKPNTTLTKTSWPPF